MGQKKNYGVIVHREDFDEFLLNMSDSEAGAIIKNMLKTFLGEEVQEFEERYMKSVSNNLCKRVEWDKAQSEKQSRNGSQGGGQIGNQNASKKENDPKTSENERKTSEERAKTNLNINIKSNSNNNINNKYIVEILAYLNERMGTHYGESKETVRLINGRMNEGFTVDDFKKVIDKKVKEWKGTEHACYIRPSTLFAPSHFEEYLNAPEKEKPKPSYTNNILHHMAKADYDMEALEKKLVRN